MKVNARPGEAARIGPPTIWSALFQRKQAQQLIDEAYRPDNRLRPALGPFDLVAFGIGAIIGSGIFALTGTAAAGQLAIAKDWMSTPIINFLFGSPIGREGAGPAIVISFLVAGFACALAALCYAELASTIPVSGSAYTFAYAALGQLVAWIIGWDLILEYGVGAVAVAIGWSGYFLHFWHGVTGLKLPLWLTTDTTTAVARLSAMTAEQQTWYCDLNLPVILGRPLALNLPAFAIIALVTAILVLGIRESARVNTAMVFTKVLVILFFIAVGSAFINPANWTPFAPAGLAGIMGGAAIVFFAFIGFDAVSATAEEARNPQRDLPIGIIGSLAICTVLYVAVSLVLTGVLPYTTYAGDPAPVATALKATGQPFAQAVVSLGALAGMTSVLLVLLLGQPRIFMAMARDRLLPSYFARIHPKFRTPYIPTIVTGAAVGLMALSMDIGQAAELTNIGTLAAFCLVCIGVLLHRRLEPERKRPFRCPMVPFLPVVGAASCLILMLSLPVVTWSRFVGWMVFGLAIYILYGARRACDRRLQTHVR